MWIFRHAGCARDFQLNSKNLRRLRIWPSHFNLFCKVIWTSLTILKLRCYRREVEVVQWNKSILKNWNSFSMFDWCLNWRCHSSLWSSLRRSWEHLCPMFLYPCLVQRPNSQKKPHYFWDTLFLAARLHFLPVCLSSFGRSPERSNDTIFKGIPKCYKWWLRIHSIPNYTGCSTRNVFYSTTNRSLEIEHGIFYDIDLWSVGLVKSPFVWIILLILKSRTNPFH